MGKVRISLPISLSTIAGYVLYSGHIGYKAWLLSLGVFFMACSSGALNHWQEWKTDALMPRTLGRPIPSGKITPGGALNVAIALAFTGSFILFFSNPASALFFSWLTLIFYNLVYTPFKKITAFAVIPGSFVGALPPIIGWTAAGGSFLSEKILLVSFFFFIGQIPHFWLLLMMFGDQYKMANLPSLNQIFNSLQLKRITYTWILTSLAAALLVVFVVISSDILRFFLIFYIFYLIASISASVFLKKEFTIKPVFYKLNFLYLFMMLFLIFDSLHN